MTTRATGTATSRVRTRPGAVQRRTATAKTTINLGSAPLTLRATVAKGYGQFTITIDCVRSTTEPTYTSSRRLAPKFIHFCKKALAPATALPPPQPMQVIYQTYLDRRLRAPLGLVRALELDDLGLDLRRLGREVGEGPPHVSIVLLWRSSQATRT